jgi:hypothetical protein
MSPGQILPVVPSVLVSDQPATFGAEVVGSDLPSTVTLHLRPSGAREFESVALSRRQGYRYAATVPKASASSYDYFITAQAKEGELRFPATDSAVLTVQVVAPSAPLPLFNAASDIKSLVYTRIGDTVRRGIFKELPATATEPAALRLMFPLSMDKTLDDYTASLAVRERVSLRAAQLKGAKAIRVKARASAAGQPVYLTLVESDGTSWSKRLELTADWSDTIVPLADLQVARGVKLPLGYPERWNYWTTPAQGRGGAGDHLNLTAIEHVQISFRPGAGVETKPSDTSVDLATVELSID